MNEPITCDKLVDLVPTWAPFPGWTVLLDPGPRHHAPDPVSGLSRLALDPSVWTEEPLLAALRSVAEHLAASPPGLGITALLPPDTYHVTLCDGFSVRSPSRAAEPAATRLQEMIDALPGAVVDTDALTLGSGVALTALLDAAAGSITFAFDALEVRGTALVAALETIDAAVPAIVDARATVLTEMSAVAGQDLVVPWRPHISLAYLANESREDAWASVLQTASAELATPPPPAIGYRGAATYAFADMITFRRAESTTA